MLTRADRELLRRDKAIPGLALALDPEALIDALGPRLIAGANTGAAVTYLRYKPGRNCLTGFRLQSSNGPVEFYVTAYGPDAAHKVRKRQQRLLDSNRSIRPVAVWPETGIVVHAFPNDEVLKLLPRIADADRRSALLRKIVPDRPALWDARVEYLRYKPLRRFVARLHGADRNSAVLKLFDDRDGPDALTAAKRLHSSDSLYIRQPLGRSRIKQLLVLEWLEGEILADLISNPHRATGVLSATGVALRALHRQSTRRLPLRTPDQDSAAVAAAAEWVAQVCPPLAHESRTLAAALAERLSACPVFDTTVHGDMHARQVLASGTRISLLDVDRAARGHPAIDLGGFQAYLEYEALTGRLSVVAAEQLREALLDGYASDGGGVERSALAIYTAAGLLRLVPEVFRRREPEWPQVMATMIRRAQALLKPATLTAARLPVADDGILNDPETLLLSQALDAARMEDILLTALKSTPGLGAAGPLPPPRVLRRKPGRRCLIEYRLTETTTGKTLPILGKIRTKGLDRTAYALHRALWHHGFGPDSRDQILVPEPVGVVPTLNMWLQRKVAGIPSIDLLSQDKGVRVAQQIAEALYKLHRHGPVPRRQHRVGDELRILETALNAVIQGHPRLRSRIQGVLEACRQQAAAIPPAAERPIHRDFYPDQVMVDGSRLFLLDLDLYAHGDPAVDVGNFVAHVHEYALRRHGDPDALNGPAGHFVARYLSLNDDASLAAIEAYTTLSLARLIAISQRIPGRQRFTVALVDLCEHRLGIGAAKHAAIRFA